MITREEYELLKNYRDKGYRWIVRDGDDECLYVYKSKPIKLSVNWGTVLGCYKWPVNDNSLPFVKWEDEKPTKIDDLIRDYESHQVITGGNNSNKAELVKEIEEILDDIGVSDYQLGECDEDTIWTISSITIREIFSAIEKHIPVSVGEKVKVTVPQYVADWIQEVKGTYTLKLLFANSDMPSSVEDWLYCNNDNCELMALAWIFGYEVEKEKLYIIELPNKQRLASVCGVVKFYDEATWVITGINTRLTQTEIESIDPVLMQIAKEVE